MSLPPVVVLAAGRGSRFGTQSSHIHKALLPIQGRPVLNHILDLFPGHPLVFAVGHLEHQLREYLQVLSPSNPVTFVRVENFDGSGSGPGRSLLACREAVLGPFYTISCDTLVKDPIPPLDCNWLGVAPIDNPARFCTVAVESGLVRSIDDKNPMSLNRLAYIGLAGIRDVKVFWKALERSDLVANEHQVSNGLKSLLELGLVAKKLSWIDTGTPEALGEARKKMGDVGGDFSKSNEQTYLVDPLVIKWSQDSKSIAKKVYRAGLLKGLVPKVKKQAAHFFSYDFVEGAPLYQRMEYFKMADLLTWLKVNLWQRPLPRHYERAAFHAACHSFYQRKTLDRLASLNQKKKSETLSANWENFLNRANAAANRIPWELFAEKAIPCVFHGDLNFGNILKSADSFCLIDWREEFAELDYGDLYYDLGKLYAGLCVDFELIRQEGCPRFSVGRTGQSTFALNNSSSLEGCKAVLEDFCMLAGWDFSHVQLVAATTFLNMAPLHASPLDGYFLAVGLGQLEGWNFHFGQAYNVKKSGRI